MRKDKYQVFYDIAVALGSPMLWISADRKIRWYNRQAEALLPGIPSALGAACFTRITGIIPAVWHQLAAGRLVESVSITWNGPETRLRLKCQLIPVIREGSLVGALCQLFPDRTRDFGLLASRYSFEDIHTRDASLLKAISAARRLAVGDQPILITGETGVGKERFVHAIHRASSVANGPFVAINCAAVPTELVESELFGYLPGSFTGADRHGRPGKFEMASGGTLFLDEIADLPLRAQGVLLRVLSSGELYKVGDSRPTTVNVRVIAATNRKLTELCGLSTFRWDLYYRLAASVIDIPPLRARLGDIPLLVEMILSDLAMKYGAVKVLTGDAQAYLQLQLWPGNVRQLAHVLEQSYLLSPVDTMSLELVASVYGGSCPPDAGQLADRVNDELLVSRAVTLAEGNVSRAARLLGISRVTLYRKLRAYGFPSRTRAKGQRQRRPYLDID
ncbi:MAG: sigma 54-interacting transcriptional regulator [Bacillota bacterium]